jgi:hypothetical protein
MTSRSRDRCDHGFVEDYTSHFAGTQDAQYFLSRDEAEAPQEKKARAR